MRVVPSEPHPQPLYAKPLPVQVEEGLTVASAVEEPAAPPPPVVAVVVGEGQEVMETITPKRHWSHRLGPPWVARMW
jgi:hypothetical protein